MDRKTKELTPDEISNVVGGSPGAEYITREDAEICYGDPEMGPVLSFPFGSFHRNQEFKMDSGSVSMV